MDLSLYSNKKWLPERLISYLLINLFFSLELFLEIVNGNERNTGELIWSLVVYENNIFFPSFSLC